VEFRTEVAMMTNGKSMYQDWRESRRMRAWELKQMGWKQSDIAVALGVTKGAVSQWLKRSEEGGKESLRSRPTPGRPARLSAEQKATLPELLKQGPRAFGFQADVWTAERVADLIEHQFGVRYHPDHVGRLLRDAGLSPYKGSRSSNSRVVAPRVPSVSIPEPEPAVEEVEETPAPPQEVPARMSKRPAQRKGKVQRERVNG